MTVRLGVTGATGRMGREVLAVAADREDCDVVLAVSHGAGDEATPAESGHDVEPAAEFGSLLADREPNAVIDFTAPEATREYASVCADAGVPLVTGTTGFDDEGYEALRAASEETAVLHAPNFARGVQTLLDVVGEAVERLPGYDVELVETHHAGKRDAPSGTANRLLDEVESRGDFGERVHGREGDAPRGADEIGVHSLRAGDVTGEHEVVLAGDHEAVRLAHRADDRGVFAAGALDAAVWLAGRDAGWYDFAEVLEG